MSDTHPNGRYLLGVDLGTTYSAAAVWRDGQAQMVELGNRTASIPSVVFLAEDGSIVAGEPANRRGVTAPDRVAREFKRRIGNDTALLVGGSPTSAESLTAKLLESIIDRVSALEGAAPYRISVTHPANWGPYKLDRLSQAFRMADLANVATLSEPAAAALHDAAREHTPAGTVIGVFDLGGGTFDAAVLRKTETGFELLGEPDGIEHLGGIDFDEAVFGFVRRALGGTFDDLDPSDPATIAAATRLRRECVAAKEALSLDTEVAIPVVLPSVSTEVRLTRGEFEDMIRPTLNDAMRSMQRAIRASGVGSEGIDRLLLIGGSSRIPLVSEMVRSELDVPVVLNAHPKNVVALGAALAGADQPVVAPTVDPTPVVIAPAAEPIHPTEPLPPTAPVTATPPPSPAPPLAPSETRQPVAAATAPTPVVANASAGNSNSRSMLPAIGAIVAAALIGLVAWLAIGGSSEGDPIAAAPPPTAVPTPEAVADPTPAQAVAVSAEPTATPWPTATAEPTVAPSPTATVEPTPTPFGCASGFCTHIDNVEIVDGEMVIAWTAFGFEPSVNNFHAHFFYNIYEPNQVGTNAAQLGAASQGAWQLTDLNPFTTAGSSVALASAPAGTTQICVVAADSGHGVTNPENAECVDIPTELRR